MAWPKFRCKRSRTRDIARQERSPTPARPIWAARGGTDRATDDLCGGAPAHYLVDVSIRYIEAIHERH
jgi:hypothetical protein